MRLRRLLNFTGDRLHTLPLVVLYLTDGCNSRCVACDIWRSPRRNMDMRLVDLVADECASLQVRWVLLSGGEAMQHPEWPEIGRRLRAQGVHVMLLTNGLLLRKQIEQVRNSVAEVIVSLDGGTAQTYEAVRGVDAFDLVLDGMREVSMAGIPVTTRTTVQRANCHELPQIVRAARDAGARSISFLAVDVSNPFAFGPRFENGNGQTDDGHARSNVQLFNSTAPSREQVDALDALLAEMEVEFADEFASGLIAESPDKLRRTLVQYFGAMHGMHDFDGPRCNAPHFSTVIEVDGKLRPCYFLPEYGQLSVESVRGRGALRQAINASRAFALRAAYRGGERAECKRCVCPLYRGPRALLSM